jgi:Tfp pilus assembly protein PilW
VTRLIARLRRAHDDSRGLSLVEVLVASGITMVVLTLVSTAVIGGFRLFNATDAETSGQSDVRTTIERLGRDVRNARSIDAGATGSRLVLWIDSDSDYAKDTAEIITWELVGPVDGHYDVRRAAQGATPRVQSNLVVSQLAFTYRAAAGGAALALPLSAADALRARIVTGSIQYDATVGSGTDTRVTEFTERVRNVE